MRRHMKKILGYLLTICLICGCIPLEALATEQAAEQVVSEEVPEAGIMPDETDADTEKPHVIGEIVEKRETNVKHFRMSDGSIMAAMYPQEVHYEDESGALVDIDNSFVDGSDDSDNVYENSKNEFQVKFMKKSNKNKLYTLNKGQDKITVSIEGVSKVEAETKDISAQAEALESDYGLSNLGSSVVYRDIFEHVDIEYTVVSKNVKENIILKEAVDFSSVVYNYKFGNHLEVISQDEQTIVFQDASTGELAFQISAPAMWDSAGNYYDDLTLTVLEAKNGKASIELSWDEKKLEDAVYPVTVDPVLSFSYGRLEIKDTYIVKSTGTTNYNVRDHIKLRNDGYALLEFPTPELNSGDKIVYAELILAPYMFLDGATSEYSNTNSYNPSLYITSHKILKSWDESTVTYNSAGADSGFYDSTVYSYRILDNDNDFYRWDITRLANEWTEGGVANNGVLLKFDRVPSNGGIANAFFCSTNGTYNPAAYYPQILYQYINTTGVEDYFSYHTQDLGYAGTAYTNDLTGNLTVINPVVQTGGSVMPITVSLVYNTNSINDSETPYGRGWKLNWSQTIDRTIESDFGYYIAKYVDGDGTEHYFNYDSSTGLFVDEIDSKRKLVYIDADNYIINDSSGTSLYFKRHPDQRVWYLWKMADAYGNYISAELNSSNGNRVDRLSTSTGSEVNFNYNQYNFLIGIDYYDKEIEKTITIDYNNYISKANNCIGKIIYPDNSFVQYHYYYSNQPYCISKVVDVNGTSIAYAYNTQGAPRTNCIREYSSQGEMGNTITASYDAGGTTFTDVANNRKYLYTFANNGTLKSVVDVTSNDGNGYGQYYEYNNGNTSSTQGKGNLTFVSKTQKSAVNMLRNHSFENNTFLPYLQAWSETIGTSTAETTTGKSFIGTRSYKLTRPAGSNSNRTLGYYRVNVVAGKKYTLSAYVNTAEMISQGKGASVYVGVTGIQYESEFVTETNNEWQRVFLTFIAPYTETISICLSLKEATGSVYFDNIQFEEGDLSDYNLLENAGFEQDNIAGDNGWQSFTEALDYTTVESSSGLRSGRRIGGIQIYQEYRQLINITNGKSGDTYVASAFAKATSIPAKDLQFALLVRFSKDGVDVNEQKILFNSYTTEWQKIAGVAKASGDYDTIQFWLLYYGNCNTVYFDNAQLIKDTFGTTYTYDSKGNLISTIDLQEKEEYTFQYDSNNQLIKQTNVAGGVIDYTYNSTVKQQLDAVASGGVTTSYTYDSRGNALSSVTKASGTETPTITSSATYSSNGEYMLTVTDSRGNTTQYTYNETRGYVDYVTAPDGSVTDYTYNGSELLTGVSLTKDDITSSVGYNYNTIKQLTSILSPSGTTYGFTYDTFGRSKDIKIGETRTLSSYLYDSKGLLEQLTYGNGTTISYDYDDLNRQTDTTINNILRYQYLYDGNSRLLEVLDIIGAKKLKYDYDILDRLATERIYDTTIKKALAELYIRYDDSKNRVSGYDVEINGNQKSTDYVYGELTKAPDIITGVKQDGTRILTYGYDALNRLTTRTIVTTTPFVTEYGYLQGATTDKTTTLVESVKNGNDTLEYTYDVLGNITSVSKNGSVIESYTYDNLNQLKTVTRGTDVYEYTYDNGGNILSVTENGTTIKTYTYGDSEWKDLLITYNGESITYDGIGNPLTYRDGMNFTWTDGRKLSSITKGTDSISYTYDANGLRTSKTVNETTTEYYWLNGMLQGQKTGDEYILFLYDENGVAYGFIVQNETEKSYYYYEFNLQSDIIGIIDSTGNRAVEYTYNEWGKLLSITGTLADTIGQKNPLRYRGYYYDAETGFYLTGTRYYDPEIGRFINADGQLNNDILGTNLFAYCGNNPVTRADETGQGWWVVAGAAIGALAGFATKVVSNIASGNKWNEGVIGATIGGAVYGGVLAATGNVIAAGFASAAVESVTNEVISYTPLAKYNGTTKKKVNQDNVISSVANVIVDTALNGTASSVTGAMAGKIVPTNNGWFKPKKFTSSFVGKYAVKSELQTLVQSGLLFCVEGGKMLFNQAQQAIITVFP